MFSKTRACTGDKVCFESGKAPSSLHLQNAGDSLFKRCKRSFSNLANCRCPPTRRQASSNQGSVFYMVKRWSGWQGEGVEAEAGAWAGKG